MYLKNIYHDYFKRTSDRGEENSNKHRKGGCNIDDNEVSHRLAENIVVLRGSGVGNHVSFQMIHRPHVVCKRGCKEF